MSNTPHELHEEFPAKAEAIAALRASDEHFRKLADSFYDVNRALHRAETRVEAISEQEGSRLRRLRLSLKDQIAKALG